MVLADWRKIKQDSRVLIMTDRRFRKRASCKRAAGHGGTGRRGEGNYSSMVVVKISITHGTCSTCPREDQELVNGRCDSCRWYDDKHDVDADLSARARRGKGGVNDWVRKARA